MSRRVARDYLVEVTEIFLVLGVNNPEDFIEPTSIISQVSLYKTQLAAMASVTTFLRC
jgi:hypothetical protein